MTQFGLCDRSTAPTRPTRVDVDCTDTLRVAHRTWLPRVRSRRAALFDEIARSNRSLIHRCGRCGTREPTSSTSPEDLQHREAWQHAVELLLRAAESGDHGNIRAATAGDASRTLRQRARALHSLPLGRDAGGVEILVGFRHPPLGRRCRRGPRVRVGK